MNSENPQVVIIQDVQENNQEQQNIQKQENNQEQNNQEQEKLLDEMLKPKIRFVIAGTGNLRNSSSYLEITKRGVDLTKVYSQPVVVEEEKPKKQYTKNYDSKKPYYNKEKKPYNTEKKPYYNKNKDQAPTTKTE